MGETGTPQNRDTRADSDTYRHIQVPLPRSASIIEAFQGNPDSGAPGHAVLLVACDLAASHHEQWAEENVCRCSTATAEQVAASKRRIDELNAQRVTLVERIDLWVLDLSVPGRPEGSLHTETLGSVVDRLAIAWVRAGYLIRRGDDRERARIALQQLAELADSYDDLVRDVESGNRRLPTWRPLKTYTEASLHER